MDKIIAIKKEMRLSDATQSQLSSEEKREVMVKGAHRTERANRLLQDDFKEIEVPEKVEENFTPLPTDEPAFGRLGYLDAYVVSTPDIETYKLAVQHLSRDYYIIQNLALQLPPAPELDEMQPTPRKRKENSWTEESGIALAHVAGITGQGVQVGVLDTGCDADHVEFKNKDVDFIYVNPLDPDRSQHDTRAFDTNGHGTHVCGIIGGKTVGVAPDATLMVAAVVDSESAQTSLERIVFGLNWMLSKFENQQNRSLPTIINMSLGFRPEVLKREELQAFDISLKQILSTLLLAYDVLPIVAIGNDGAGKVMAPGYYAETLSVGAVDFKGQPCSFSGSGKSPDSDQMQPDLVGYGEKVYSSQRRNRKGTSLFATDSGTSMATPYVAGIAALYAAASPDFELQGVALRDKLITTALKLEANPDRVGAGLARFVKD